MECNQCGTRCIKKGIRNGRQQYYCKTCRKYMRAVYRNRKITEIDQTLMLKLNNVGVCIRGIAKTLSVAASSVLRHLNLLSSRINLPQYVESNQDYEVDEIQTYIGSNLDCRRIYIMYAINKQTRKVVHFLVGRRTKENLQRLIDKIMLLNPRRIYTDKLNIYRSIIDSRIHRTRQYAINRIERMNLNLRTHLKRLSRRTICFSRSQYMLEACLKIYFWR